MKLVAMPFFSIFFLFNFSVFADSEINFMPFFRKGYTNNPNENCKSADPFSVASISGIDSVLDISNFMAPRCDKKLEEIAINYKLYSKQYCEKMLSCRKTILDGAKSPGVIKNLEFVAELNLQELLQKRIVGMEKIERVREFAKKKGMSNIVQNCPSRFNPVLPNTSNKCIQRFNNSFKALAENNQIYFGFKLENSSPVVNQFSNYFNKRVEDHTTKLITHNDDSNIDHLSTILSMPDRTNIEKKKLFIDFLTKQDGSLSLDPILAYPQVQNILSGHENFLENVLNQKKIPTKEEAKKQLLTYREERAKEILGRKICVPSWDFDHMCSFTERIATGTRAGRGVGEAQRIFQNERMMPNAEILKRVKSTYLPEETENEDYESAKIILEAMRCSSFEFDHHDDHVEIEYSPMEIPKAQAVDDDENSIGKVLKVNSEVNTDFNVPANGPAQTSNAETVATKASSARPEDVHIGNINSPTDNPVVNNGTVRSIPDTVIDDANQANASAATPSIKEKSAAENEIQTKITELSKRLEAANDKIAKMNAEKETSASASINEEKKSATVNEESKIVNDLKSQINDLKFQIKDLRDQKAIIEQKNAGVNISSNIKPAVVTSGVDANESNEEKTSFKNTYYPKGINSDYASASVNANTSGINDPKRVVYDSSKKQLDITLSDNSMKASENFSAAINKKITDLDNKPFYIEESGMIKEIIPILNPETGKVVLDEKGDPKFEKITRGKIGEKFVIPKGSILISAPTTSIGDLVKKDEVQMRKPSNTFRYQQLVKTTADGIKDK